MSTAAIVLAGGASRRFGRDKLAEPIDGGTLLERAIDAVRPVADTIVVVLAPDDTRPLPDGVRIARDRLAHEGPLAGVVAGLGAVEPDAVRVIVVGGDMPSIGAAVVTTLLGELDDPSVDAAWLTDDEGRERPLPLALGRAPALATAMTLLEAGERRLRALPLALDAVAVPRDVWRPLDPDGDTLRDVDTPADLERG
jgi:molybdopterin-guanine dinucleotide biosynthesis protein A